MGKLDPRKMVAAGLVIAGVTLYMLSSNQSQRRLLGHLLAAVASRALRWACCLFH